MVNEMFSRVVPCGYYAYTKMINKFEEIGDYPIEY